MHTQNKQSNVKIKESARPGMKERRDSRTEDKLEYAAPTHLAKQY